MRALFLFLLLIHISGCATIISQSDGHDNDALMCDPEQGFSTIYSGTKLDAHCLYINADNAALFCFLDLPLSLVADTIILPYTIYSEVTDTGYCEEEEPRKSPKRDSPPEQHKRDQGELIQTI